MKAFKMVDFGFGTSRCIYCGDMGYRNLMSKTENGWAHERCKERDREEKDTLFRDIYVFLKRKRLEHAKKE